MSKRIEKCNAIALKITNYSNTSQIIQFMTDRFGKVGVIAKGSRNPKSKMQGVLQNLSQYEIVIYKKANTLSLLKEVYTTEDNKELFDDIYRTASAQAAAEVYLQLIFEENDYRSFYDLLHDFLNYLKKLDERFIIIFWRFLLRVASYLGFSMEFNSCVVCSETALDAMHGISFHKNGFICKKCAKKKPTQENYLCSTPTIDLLANLKTIGNKLDEVEVTPYMIKEVNAVFKNYFQYQFHKKFHLRSLEIF